MYYSKSGKGKVVVLIHGFVEEGSMWDDMAKVLSKNYKVIVPDLEGFGNSPLLASSLSMEYYADEIYALLQKEKVKQCVMLGHSMGGYVTLQFAEKYPAMLRGIGLLNSHCYEDSVEKKANRKKGNEFIQKHGAKVFVRELYRLLFHPSFQKKNPKLINNLTAKAEKYSPEALIAANTAMMNRKDKSQVLKEAKVPVLLISGKEDETVPLEFSLKQASLANVTDFHLFPKTKHMSMFEKKKETKNAILNYIEFCF